MLQVGKLYVCEEYFLMLYPDPETAAHLVAAVAAAAAAVAAATAAVAAAVAHAAYWTRELGKSVSYCNPQTPLLVLSVKEKYIEVLAGDRKGWIIVEDWLKIKEIK